VSDERRGETQVGVTKPRVTELADRSIENIGHEVRFCDSCSAPQLWGCVAAVEIGWGYYELCEECLAELVAKGAAALGWGLEEQTKP